MSIFSRPYPVSRKDVLELPRANGAGGTSPSSDNSRGRPRSRTASRSSDSEFRLVLAAAAEHVRELGSHFLSDRQAWLLLMSALAMLPGFIPDPAVANELFISGGGGGGVGTGGVVGNGGAHAGKGYNSYGGGGAYVGDGTGTQGGDGSYSGGGGAGAKDTAPTGGGIEVEAKNGGGSSDSTGGDASVKVTGDFSGYDAIHVEAGGGGGTGSNTGDTAARGGHATFTVTGELSLESMDVKAGDGGNVHNSYGSSDAKEGGNASLKVGTLNANEIALASGKKGTDGNSYSGGAGGEVSAVIGTLSAPIITLKKEDGDLAVDVGTLNVSENTTLSLTNTGAWNNSTGVRFGTIDIAGGKTLSVTGSGAYSFETLNVLGKATYSDSNGLDATSKTLSFDLANTAMLTVSQGDATISDSTINLTGHDRDGTYTLIETKTGTISGDLDSIDFLIGGKAVDNKPSLDSFLTAELQKVGSTKLNAEVNAVWNLPADAHGTFELSEGSRFTLGTSLADNVAGANPEWWDGTKLTKTGLGTLILEGSNTYTGGTFVDAGTLAGNIPVGGDLRVAADATYDGLDAPRSIGALSGTGTVKGSVLSVRSGSFDGLFADTDTLIKQGNDKLILNNVSGNSQVGTVEVKAGSLIVGGSSVDRSATLAVTNSVKVSDGAVLGGHGVIKGDVYIFDGTLSPGNSYGTLTVLGKLSFDQTSHFDVEIGFDSNGNAIGDSTEIDGSATLAGTLSIIVDKEDTPATPDMGWIGKEWTILSTKNGVITDKFQEVTSEFTRLSPNVDYGPTDVVLSFTRDDTLFDDSAKSEEKQVVAYALKTLDPNGELNRELDGITAEQDLPRLLNELSGELHATLKGTLLKPDDIFTRRFLRHASTQSARRGTAFHPTGTNATGKDLWISVNHNTLTADGNRGAARATRQGTEIAFGHDIDLADGWLGGFAFRFDDGELEVKRRRSEADITSGTVALYGGREFPLGSGALRVLLASALTRHDIDSKRHVLIGTRNQKLEAHYGGNTLTGAFEMAYRFSSPETLIAEPFAALTWHRLNLDGFTEKRGAAALHNRGETWSRTLSTLGLRFSTPAQARVTFDAEVGWQHLFGSATPKNRFTFNEGSGKFTIAGADLNKDAVLLGLGVGAKIDDNTRLRLQYAGELGSQGQNHEGQVVLEIKW